MFLSQLLITHYLSDLIECHTIRGHYSLMRGHIKGPGPLVNPMQSDNTFISHVVTILHGNSTPKATNL